jgi:hypothetical protein
MPEEAQAEQSKSLEEQHFVIVSVESYRTSVR